MTEREMELLAALHARGDWSRPMDVGGSSCSFHSITLRRMIPKGWVESDRRAPYAGTHQRGGLAYRITKRGRDALYNARATKGAEQ